MPSEHATNNNNNSANGLNLQESEQVKQLLREYDLPFFFLPDQKSNFSVINAHTATSFRTETRKGFSKLWFVIFLSISINIKYSIIIIENFKK